MPKITPWEDKERWYSRSEQGETVATMAREYQKDPRTVQRGIDDVRRHRATREAREALLRESLRQHLKDLLDLVERAARVVVPAPAHLPLRFPGEEPPRFLELGPMRVDRQGDEFERVTLEVEQEFTWGLLKEHLGRSPAFRQLARWKRAFLEALNSHLGLREGLLTELRAIGLSLGDDVSQIGTMRPATAEELARAAVSQILEEDPPHELLVVTGERGEFLVNGSSARLLLPDGESPQEAMRGLVNALVSSGAGQALGQAYSQVNAYAGSLREALELVRASYYIPGTCRACRRYGGI
ncbi:MAG: hypothetical protein IH936_06710 [Acidobacteria bacterium]|nr:hypothetical protein [Acidobacteriota bacterium]